MLVTKYKARWNLNYYYGADPFSLEDVYSLQKKQASSDGALGALGAPTFYDIRAVDLVQQDSAELKRLIAKRRALGEQYSNNAFVTVVGCEGCFGMMRMYNTYAELSGLRAQDRTLVSFSMKEAVQWIAPYLAGDVDEEELLADLEAEGALISEGFPKQGPH